jgi:hypothetical protein
MAGGSQIGKSFSERFFCGRWQSQEVSADVSDLHTFFTVLIPKKNAQEASQESTEHSRSERTTLAKLLKVIEEHDGTTMTSRS